MGKTALAALGCGLFVALLPAAAKEAASPYAGEFMVSRNEFQNPICAVFTRNLNEFRKLPITQCHPRLSKKYPEFSRPHWEEIPFDLELARQGFAERRWPSPQIIESHWKQWLEGVSRLLERKEARMWRTRIDIDGDGQNETLIRMLPGQSGIPAWMPDQPPYSCDYNLGESFIAEGARPLIARSFNGGFGQGDILHYAGDDRYYLLEWRAGIPAYPEIKIGATGGVIVSQINWDGYRVTTGTMCQIDWVPTGQFRPPKRPKKP